MPFTDEDKKELRVLIEDALDASSQRRRERFMAQQAQDKKADTELKTKLFLVTIPGRIAVPDDKGRVIFTECVIGNVKVNDKGDMESFLGTYIEIVAFGDGKLLDPPYRGHLTGHQSAVELPDGFLQSLK